MKWQPDVPVIYEKDPSIEQKQKKQTKVLKSETNSSFQVYKKPSRNTNISKTQNRRYDQAQYFQQPPNVTVRVSGGANIQNMSINFNNDQQKTEDSLDYGVIEPDTGSVSKDTS